MSEGSPSRARDQSPHLQTRPHARKRGVRVQQARAPRAPRSRRPHRGRWERPGVGQYQRGARARLGRLRASMLAVALTALLLILWGVPPTAGQEAGDAGGTGLPSDAAAPDDAPREDRPDIKQVGEAPVEPLRGIENAAATVRDLLLSFYGLLPGVIVAILILALAALAARVFGTVVHRTLSGWEKSEAVAALGRIVIYLLALGAALSVIAGDARALVGSIGLTGLALSWALQTPIESFTGWVINSFHSYYQVGDRIEVGDVFGDVYKIDVLTTTVWEAGGPGKAVGGAQPTGAMITFPNWEVLRSNIVNYSRDFPYVWDEITVQITNESDLVYTIDVLQRVAEQTVGQQMAQPAEQYRALLRRARMGFDIAEDPTVFVTSAESWTNCTIRYLVPARERRRWSTKLLVEVTRELARPEHTGRVKQSYPRSEIVLRRDWDQPREA